MFRLSSLDRGWSGTRMPGRSIGAPDAINGDDFDGFDTRVLEMKTVCIMKGNLGRKRRQSCFAVTGNGKGLAGFATAKSVDAKAALRKVKNRAAQKLVHIDICDEHTVNHDFVCEFGLTRIFVTKKPKGYGLICHRAIKTICQCIGIKDLHAKVEGATNVQHITKAFFLGLLQQKSYQQIAEEKGLHVVEFRSANGNFPHVVASPAVCRKAEDIRYEENLNFTQHVLDDRIIYRKKKRPPFYSKYRSYQIHLWRQEKLRNHDKIKLDMLVHYGEYRSFLTDKYPECRPARLPPKKKDDELAEDEEEAA